MAKRKRTKKSVAIDTIPLPEAPIDIDIPIRLLREFKGDVRFVIRRGGTQGIILPDNVLKSGIASKLKGFDIMLVPK